MTYDPNSSGALSYLGAAAELADRGVAPSPAIAPSSTSIASTTATTALVDRTTLTAEPTAAQH
jgi:hypothetical protein